MTDTRDGNTTKGPPGPVDVIPGRQRPWTHGSRQPNGSGPRAELFRRPLHRPVNTAAAVALSLLVHGALFTSWWSGVLAPIAPLAPSSTTSARSALRIEHNAVHIVPLPSSAVHTIIDDPPRDPQDEARITLLDEAEPLPIPPDLAWFDNPSAAADEALTAFTIRARRRRHEPAADPSPSADQGAGETSAPLARVELPTQPAMRPPPTTVPETSDATDRPDESTPESPPDPAPDPSAASDAAAAVRAPRPGSDNRPPRYPAAARRRGWEGRVILHVVVDALGTVISVEIRQSSGRKLLDQAATEAVLGWTFEPGLDGDSAVEGETDVAVRFELEG